ncbi:MAG: S41 family peptidase [Bacteroidales bacterium]|nr:S41 family peptidase [Bacteroidales bacterium]
MNKYKNTKLNIVLPLIIAVSIVIGIIIAEFLNKNNNSQGILISYPKDKLNIVVDYVANEYVDKVDRNRLAEIAIPKFLETLDPHSLYFTAEEAKIVEEELKGEFSGIGVQFNIFKDTVLVVNVIEGGPSEKYGVKNGDRIIMVNDSLIAGIGIKNDQVMSLLKGTSGSTVELKLLRREEKQPIKCNIVRGNIPLRSIEGFYIIDKNIGYIKISTFSLNTHNQFIDAVFQMRKKGIKSIILDLRNNSGGYLNSATDITDEFFESGKTLVYTQGNARPKNIIQSTKKRNACLDLEIIVLIDEFSASASEIIAGAIQDNDRGFIIGRRSYGKGLVQESTTFDDGSIIRLTTARYYTPSGRCIQKSYENGLDEYYSDIYNRYINGEFLQEDSIKQIDSLIYYTENGRAVYGGGGIMPDIFIPIDTSGYTKLYAEINKSNLEYYFSIEFVDKNRAILEKITTLSELKNYLKLQNINNQFWQYAAQNGINAESKDLAISGEYIENSVSAYITRQVLGDDEFYEIANKYDIALDSAVNIIKSKRKIY